MAFTENLSDFINPDTPGYVLTTILGASVAGIFLNEYENANLGLAGFEAAAPQLHVRTVDIPTVVHNTPVLIGAITYKVAEKHSDGTGISVLVLKK